MMGGIMLNELSRVVSYHFPFVGFSLRFWEIEITFLSSVNDGG